MPEWVDVIIKRHGFNSLDDLYAGVGYGGLTAQKVVLRLRENWLRVQRDLREKKRLEDLAEGKELPEQPEPKHRGVSDKGIIVKGIDNCLIRLAHCCNPVAGDDIIGFITRGRGVSVHRRDCPNMNIDILSDEDKSRIIEVEWADNTSESYVANLQAELPNRDGVLLEITNILAGLNISFKSVNAFVNKKNMAVIQMGVVIKSTAELAVLTKKIKQIKGVTSIKRISN